jgi:hypothetical protein
MLLDSKLSGLGSVGFNPVISYLWRRLNLTFYVLGAGNNDSNIKPLSVRHIS